MKGLKKSQLQQTPGMSMALDFSTARERFNTLIQQVSPLGELSNEAQTRFDFIDRFLVECLGWPRDQISVEVFENGDRTDYECGKPRTLILEAKRGSSSFNFPPRGKGAKNRMRIRSIMEFNEGTKSAITQVISYCHDRGVPAAAISNGHQIIFFVASRLDGVSPLDGDAFIYESYEDMHSGFSTIFECLNQDGLEEKRLQTLLGGKLVGTLPQKISSVCSDYFNYKYSSDFQESIRNAVSLVIEDIGKSSEYEKEFLAECYCESGPLTQYSMLSKSLLQTRYSALFSPDEIGSGVSSVRPKNDTSKLSEKVLADAMARRPIVVLGDVGVGKTSFIKNLIHIDAEKEFDKAIFIYFDLGSEGALSTSTKDGLLSQIERSLRDGGFNLQSEALLEKVYRDELKDFDSGIWARLRERQPDTFETERLSYVSRLMSDRSEHLRRSLSEIAKIKKCQIVVVIDNADQRSSDVQQEAFLIANEMAGRWEAMTFIALRPQTFHASKRSGTISAYPPKVFTISPPKLEEAIEKRLVFALNVAEGKIPSSKLKGVSLHIDSLSIMIRVILESLRENKELYEYIINVSGGNVRIAIELITKFIGNPNVDAERIVKIRTEEGRDSYKLPLHEFSKGGLLGEYAYYQEDSSYAYNVFGVIFSDKREHFLALMILGFLDFESTRDSEADGFVESSRIRNELQSIGFIDDQILSHLKKLTRKKLIETTERRAFIGDESDRSHVPHAFRITSVGAYHLKKWAYQFSYLDAVLFETPVFDKDCREFLMSKANSHKLSDRHLRVSSFIEYMDESWDSLDARPYFDWNQMKMIGKHSFERVERRLSDLGFSAQTGGE